MCTRITPNTDIFHAVLATKLLIIENYRLEIKEQYKKFEASKIVFTVGFSVLVQYATKKKALLVCVKMLLIFQAKLTDKIPMSLYEER